MPRISKGLSQAYQLQDFTFEAAMSLRDSLSKESGKLKIAREDAQCIAALVKSWESCQQRIQVHRRVPNPGSLKHAVEKKKKRDPFRSLPTFFEPDELPTSGFSPDGAGTGNTEQ